MKKVLAMLSIGAAISLAAPFAHADNISFGGNDSYTTTAISFGTPIFGANAVVGGISTGIFSGFGDGTLARFYNFTFAPLTPGTEIFTTTDLAGETVSFVLDTENQPTLTNNNQNLSIMGDGVFTITPFHGKSSTVDGSFDLTTQGGTAGTFTFSDTNSTSVTPEPSSLVLLGTGLMSAAGMMFRRRRGSEPSAV